MQWCGVGEDCFVPEETDVFYSKLLHSSPYVCLLLRIFAHSEQEEKREEAQFATCFCSGIFNGASFVQQAMRD